MKLRCLVGLLTVVGCTEFPAMPRDAGADDGATDTPLDLGPQDVVADVQSATDVLDGGPPDTGEDVPPVDAPSDVTESDSPADVLPVDASMAMDSTIDVPSVDALAIDAPADVPPVDAALADASTDGASDAPVADAAGGDVPTDAGPTCGPAPMTICGSVCVNVTTDTANCGTCGHACPVSNGTGSCAAGMCGVAACNVGYTLCDGACVDVTRDGTNCGVCGRLCATPVNGAPTCAAGVCGITCNAGFTACINTCIDTASSTLNCGACARDCPAPARANAIAVCRSGTCGDECGTGYYDVGGTCVEIPAPRIIAPLTSQVVTSFRPTLQWLLSPGNDGAHVEISTSRSFATIEREFDVTGSLSRLATPLAPGVHFWRARGRAGTRIGTRRSSAVWQFTVGSADLATDTAYGHALTDLNGDGISDIAVGGNNAGEVYVYYGRRDAGIPTTPDRVLTAPEGRASLFGSVAIVGDVNGDRIADLLVGAVDADGGRGRAYLYLGRAGSGVPAAPDLSLDAPPGASGYGYAVAAAGDVNGDGFADAAIVGVTSETVHVYYGTPTPPGLPSMPSQTIVRHGTGFQTRSVASAGDVNGDGFSDLIRAGFLPGNQGDAQIYLGGMGGVSASPVVTLPDQSSGSTRFGTSVAGLGDMDRDGYADVAIGSPDHGGVGIVFFYRGAPAAPSMVPSFYRLPPFSEAGDFGFQVTGLGDINRDGFADIAVGDPDAASSAGRVAIYMGAASGLSTSTPTVLSAGGASYFGVGVGGAGDLNGDGRLDLLVGASQTASNVGAAYVFHGDAAGVSSTIGTTLMGTVAGAGFGRWVTHY